MSFLCIWRLSRSTYILSWTKSPAGTFSTKPAFHMTLLSNESSPNPLLTSTWKMKIPLCIQFFIWLALQNEMLTNEERQRRHLIEYDTCTSCSANSESLLHVLRDCCHSAEVWRKWELLTSSLIALLLLIRIGGVRTSIDTFCIFGFVLGCSYFVSLHGGFGSGAILGFSVMKLLFLSINVVLSGPILRHVIKLGLHRYCF